LLYLPYLKKQKVQEWKLYPFYQPGNITFR